MRETALCATEEDIDGAGVQPGPARVLIFSSLRGGDGETARERSLGCAQGE